MIADPFRFVFRARLLEVHDGDTMRFGLDRGLDGTTTPEWIRLGGPGKGSALNVYAPELADEGGKVARMFAAGWLDMHNGGIPWPFLVETWKTSGDVTKSTLARYLGNVTCATDGASLNVAVASFVKGNGYGGGTGS